LNLADIRALAKKAAVDTLRLDVPEAGSMYYRFLRHLANAMNARACLEIGTYRGSSAVHLAIDSDASVVTIDLNPDAQRCVDELVVRFGLDIVPITANSGFVLQDPAEAAKIRALAPFDILYIDGDHTFNSAYGDYTTFWPLVREGGVIVFDDITLPMDGQEMHVFWDHVVDPKVELPWLHETGFGAAIRGKLPPPPWEMVIGDATREIERRRAPRAPTG